jgi:hypothetical protein
MLIRQIITELFDKIPLIYKINAYEYMFYVNNIKFKVSIVPSIIPTNYGHYEIVLSREEEHRYSNSLLSDKNPFQTYKDFGRYGFQVFSALVNIIKNFIINNKPKELTFYGYEPKQHDFYIKLIKHLSIPGYKSNIDDPKIKDNEIKIFRESIKPLNELFNKPVQFMPSIPEKFNYFKINGVQFTVAFTPIKGTDIIEVWLHRDDRDDPFSSRGDFGSSAVAVYSTLVNIVKKYLKIYKPKALSLTGSDIHQQNMYPKLARYMLINGYRIKNDPPTTYIVRESIGPDRDEILAIQNDKQSRKKPNLRKAKFIDMPGNTSKYPAL